MKLLLAGALLIGLAAPATADSREWTVSNGGPVAHVRADGGTVTISVTRGGRTVLEPSPVGIRTDRADLTTGLRLRWRGDRVVREHYTTTVGKRRDRAVRMTESWFVFQGAAGPLGLVVRAAPDGVAYRYVLPPGHNAVLGEASAFTVPAGATAWLGRHRRDYENPFVEYPVAEVPAAEFMTPALFQVGNDFLALAESDLDGRYSGSRLVHEAGTYRDRKSVV